MKTIHKKYVLAGLLLVLQSGLIWAMESDDQEKKTFKQQGKMVNDYLKWLDKFEKAKFNRSPDNCILSEILNNPYISEDKKVRNLKTVLRIITNVDAKDEFGSRAVDYAVRCHNPTVLETLINADAKIETNAQTNETLFHEMATSLTESLCATLMKHQVDPNQKNCLGDTALHNAAFWLCPNSVKILVETCNANLNEKNDCGRTPLAEAKWRAKSGSLVALEIVTYLENAQDLCEKKKGNILQTNKNVLNQNFSNTTANGLTNCKNL